MNLIVLSGRLAAALACALALGGCVEDPAGQRPPAGALGYSGGSDGISPAAPAARLSYAPGVAEDAAPLALAAQDTAAEADAPALQAVAVNVPLPPARPVDLASGASLGPAALTKIARANPAPAAALPTVAAFSLIGPAKPAVLPKVQLASLFVEGARALLPSREALGGGAMEKQTERVETACFPASLKDALADISQHFGGPVIVTSGYRSGGENRRAGGAGHSYHVQCLAADIQIAGIAPADIASYARTLETVGGVGRYGHTKSVHVDVGERKFSWYGLHHRRRHRNA